MQYERVIGPPGVRAERVTVLDDPLMAESPDRRAEQLRLFVLQRPRVVMLLGAVPHEGLQGDESILQVVSPKPKLGISSSERTLYSDVNQSIAIKLTTKLEQLAAEDNSHPDLNSHLKTASIDTSLAVIDPSKTDPADQRGFWRGAFWAKDTYPGHVVNSFEQAAQLAALAAQLRVRFPGTLDLSVNQWWIYGGDFATWVMDVKRPDLQRTAFVRFKAGKSWQIFDNEMRILHAAEGGDEEASKRALEVFPGAGVSRYWKHSPEYRQDPLYQEIVWPYRHEAVGEWLRGKSSEHFNHWWSVNPHADEEVNKVLRTMFANDIRPFYTEERVDPVRGKIGTKVIADDQTRVSFLRGGVTNWSFASNLESAAADKLREIQGKVTPESFYPIFQTALNLAIAYPEAEFRLSESGRFIQSYLRSVAQLGEIISQEHSGVDKQLELFANYKAGASIVFGEDLKFNIDSLTMARIIGLRNRLNTSTNRNPLTESLVRLGKLQSSIAILTSHSATPTRDGLVLADSMTRDPFIKDNWIGITANQRVA